MLRSAAGFVDHPVVRVALALCAAVTTALFAMYCFVRVFEDNPSHLVELGGLLGLAGWWTRVFVPLHKLSDRPRLRWLVIGLLGTGVLTAASAFTLLPASFLSVPAAALGLGILMLLGTLETFQPRQAA